MHRSLVLVLLCCLGLPELGSAEPHPRIGLVLSGGGARGAAHVGVLKVLEELRVPISAVAGTSMGALVGGVYASGLGPAEMEARLGALDWDDLLLDEPPREDWPIRRKERDLETPLNMSLGVGKGGLRLPGGALAGQKVDVFFTELAGSAADVPRFDDLPIPFRAVATNLENGAIQVLDTGPLPRAMRASMSVPGVFSPVEIDGKLLVDGGLVRNMPVDVARQMGVDVVIAVDLGTSYLPRERLDSVVGVMVQMLQIFVAQNLDHSRDELRPGTDVLIKVDLGDVGSLDFKRSAEAIQAGERAARAMAEPLERLSLSPAEYAAWRSRLRRPSGEETTIAGVEVRGLHWVDPALFAPLASRQEGGPLDREQLRKDLQTVYARGDFLNIDYRREPLDHSSLLVIDAREKPWGPGYLNLGLGVASDFRGDVRFGLRADYRRTWMNALGAEWLTSLQFGDALGLATELYQPLGIDRRLFVAADMGFGTDPFSVFRQGSRIARYETQTLTAGVDLGATLRDGNAELRIGAAYIDSSLDRDTGEPGTLPEGGDMRSGPRLRFVLDTLDSAWLPHRGQRLLVDLRAPTPVLGADLDYRRLLGLWTGAWSRGDATLALRAQYGQAFGDPMPYDQQFPLGGFLHLSGYREEQFRGGQMAFGSVTAYRRLPGLTPSWARGLYLGTSLEAGKIADTDPSLTEPGTRFGGSLFLGLDTLIGPAWLGVGITGDSDTGIYMGAGFP
jgi:NTE family protein